MNDYDYAASPHAIRPTPERIDAHELFTGKNVTIAMLDSGFQRHPDLTTPAGRILARVDARTGEELSDGPTSGFDWHGTQTSCAAAGTGTLSASRYRGVAPDARLVLVRIGDRGRVSEDDIARGLEWVLENRDRYRIDVVNISAGGDEPVSYRSSVADQAAEEAIRRRIVVVAAAGNNGFAENHQPLPPANAPSVITVGGYDDAGGLGDREIELYRSSFGPTVDGLVKPELVAPAAWVPAPVLAATDEAALAERLVRLERATDEGLPRLLGLIGRDAGLDARLASAPIAEIREAIAGAMRERKLLGPDYQHVDGTSFAAPIVAGVVAQMLDANADLKPAAVKHILLATAERLRGADLYRQGFGMLNARRAVEEARRAPGGLPDAYFRGPHRDGDAMVFYYLDAAAESVALAGEFNGWNTHATLFDREPNGLWKVAIPCPRPGIFRYKLVVDGARWIEDPNALLKEEDPVGGFRSIVVVPEVA